MHKIERMLQQRREVIVQFPRHNLVRDSSYANKGLSGCTIREQLWAVVMRKRNSNGMEGLPIAVEPKFNNVDPASVAVLLVTALPEHDDQMCVVLMASNPTAVEAPVRNHAQSRAPSPIDIESEQAFIRDNNHESPTQCYIENTLIRKSVTKNIRERIRLRRIKGLQTKDH